jgi:hypothetical protein
MAYEEFVNARVEGIDRQQTRSLNRPKTFEKVVLLLSESLPPEWHQSLKKKTAGLPFLPKLESSEGRALVVIVSIDKLQAHVDEMQRRVELINADYNQEVEKLKQKQREEDEWWASVSSQLDKVNFGNETPGFNPLKP